MEYVPFGEVFLEEKNAVWNTPYLFNGKELDKETGMSYYGARYYEPKTSVWISVDPLAEKGPQYSPYSFCFNNPIYYVDPDGMWARPGDKFNTKVEAANDFATYYNGTSIVMSKEFGSAIYQNSDGTFSYTIAYIGSQAGTEINENIPEGTTRVSAIHSHGSEDPGYDNNNFSPTDKTAAESIGQNEYVVTPSGQLKEYDITTRTSSEPIGASITIPSDSNSGANRVNTVEAMDTQPVYIDSNTNTTINGN